ncbi:MAG: hypothetical protein CMJ78_07095 [Planctomycetaceae bacterium]|nr:hypothetical protein [Planctomycetaceae bacterium]
MSEIQKLFVFEQSRDTLIIEPQGDSVGFRATDVDKEIQTLTQLIRLDDVSNVVFDLKQANYFGSSMIGMIIALAEEMRNHGGKAVMCDVSPQMKQMLEIMKVGLVLEQFPNRRKALKAVSK